MSKDLEPFSNLFSGNQIIKSIYNELVQGWNLIAYPFRWVKTHSDK
jgi:hypothetical protein